MKRALVASLGAALAALLAFPLCVQADEGWLVDFKAAKEKSAADNKDVLMEFTGSDWCPPCIALKKQVLDTELFKAKGPEHFILLKIDGPRDKSKQSPEEIEQQKTLSAEYKITGVPTIILADSKGRPYARMVGFGGQKPEEYVENLVQQKGLRAKRDEAFAKAEKAEGVAKAKLLDEAIGGMDGELQIAFYKDVVDEIISLDAKDEGGLKKKYDTLRQTAEFKKALQDVTRGAKGDREAIVKGIDTLISEKNPQGEQLQQALMMKAQVLFGTDKAKAKEALEAALKAAPESDTGRQITQILAAVFPDKPKEEPKVEKKEEPKKP